jgi:diacylglycerol kinase (ATP)
MRAAAILGLGCSPKSLKPFQDDKNVNWLIGMPTAADPVDAVLIFGGDGTIHRYLSELVQLRVPVLIVPVGSGNDFARALGLRRVGDSLDAWQKFRAGATNTRTIDLGIIAPVQSAGGAATPLESTELPASRYFCCVAGAGIDGDVAQRANKLPRWLRAHGGYVLSLAPAIFRFAALAMKILTKGVAELGQTPENAPETWITRSDQPTILAAFANTPTYGGGMKIAPKAKLDDGLLDLCVIGGMNPFKLLCMFPTVYSGGHLQIREVQYFQASRLRIETDIPIDVYADGEYVCRTPVEIAVQRGALLTIVHPSQTSF